MWQVLVANLAVVALIISAWAHSYRRIEGKRRLTRSLIFGLVMGLSAVASMSLSVELQPGIFVDLRASLIATAALFAGPVAALITVGFALVYRIMMGGAGMWTGIAGILLAAAVGLAGHSLFRDSRPSFLRVLIVAAIAACCPLLSFTALPQDTMQGAWQEAAMPLLLLNFSTAILAGTAVLGALRLSDERFLLRAALTQAPDYLYVKNRRGEFVAANLAVARHNGFKSPAALRGLTDFDIAAPLRAEALFEAEQRAMRTGEPILDEEERLDGQDGGQRWFQTSKSPIHDSDGQVIGLTGITRDLTDRKALEADLTASRNQLSYALAEMSDGLAMFDASGTLVLCNDQYRTSFPMTAHLRTPGTHLSTILRATAETGEQTDLTTQDKEFWIASVVASLRVDGEQEVKLFDGRWLRIRTRPTEDGLAVVVVSDVTKIKQAEEALVALTEQLKLLATTDGLTGLVNRRGFDQALDTELARCAREKKPISLLLADVDRFKAYNDVYGHQAGDAALQAVAQCFKQIARRPSDIVARYGGEEFAAILSGTDEDGSFFLAEQLRVAVRALAIAHTGSEKGILTISVGIASLTSEEEQRRAADLVARADEALYLAKGAGRDRVTGRRPRHQIRPKRHAS